MNSRSRYTVGKISTLFNIEGFALLFVSLILLTLNSNFSNFWQQITYGVLTVLVSGEAYRQWQKRATVYSLFFGIIGVYCILFLALSLGFI